MMDSKYDPLEMTSATGRSDGLWNDSLQDIVIQISKCYSEKCNMQNERSMQNVIELENIPMMCIETSDEDDISEQLSLDIEQTEDQSLLASDLGHRLSTGCQKESTSILRERTENLRSEINSLRERLSKEMALWKKEQETFQLLREKSDTIAFEEATAAARAAAAAYAVESPLSNGLSSVVDIMSEQTIRELAILEYEKNLAKYQDSYSFEQAEQRYNLYKRTLIDAYKQKVSEIERLCNEELEKIRHSASCLQPFKEIASQWSIDENNHGDSNRNYNDQSSTDQFKIIERTFDNDCCLLGKIDNEVNMVPEILSARFKQEEL